jgi:hypothetical protein
VQLVASAADTVCAVDVELMMHDVTLCKHLFMPDLCFKSTK